MTISPAFEIRRLSSADLTKMRALIELFGEAFEEPETYRSAIPNSDYLERLLGKESFIVLVAERKSEIFGGLVAYVLEKFEQERSEIYIYDLAVALPHRRNGIATHLIGALRPIARTLGAYVIFVQADLGDDPAIQLYSKLGIREDVLHFDIEVDVPRSD